MKMRGGALTSVVVVLLALLFGFLPAGSPGLAAAMTEAAHIYDGSAQHAGPRLSSGSFVGPNESGRRRSALVGGPSGLVASRIAAEGRFSLLERARMGRSLNPEAGAIGGGGFTGSATAHGAERIAEAGFDDIDVALIRSGSRYEQSDGAFAYVAQASKNGYNMVIQNADGAIVTAHRGMSFSDLSGLARNYGWSGW